jgi:hypothetical protein
MISQDQHVLLAVMTCLLSCFVQIVVFMYFAVGGKLINQAVHLGHLSDVATTNSKRLRRSATKFVGLTVTSLIPVIATGASRWGGSPGSVYHLLLVILMFGVHCAAFFREWLLIEDNRVLVDKTLAEYRAKREAMQQERTTID